MISRSHSLVVLAIIYLICFAASKACAFGINPQDSGYSEADWGLAVVVRTAEIPFATEDNTVSSFVPLMFYNGRRLFMNGTEGGAKIWESQSLRLDIIGRLRFFDIPGKYQNTIQGDTVDFGGRIIYFPFENLTLALDYLSDEGGRTHGDFNVKYLVRYSGLELWPYLNLSNKGSKYNSYYYGLDRVDIDDGYEFSLGLESRYHLWKNLYAIGKLQTTWLSEEAASTEYLDENNVFEISLGVGFFNDQSTPAKERLSIKPYIRVAHGWATPSNIGEIISGHTESDPYNNQLTSVFYGFPLTDELFGLPLQIYLTPGFVHHWRSEVQSSTQEYVVAVKGYYTFNWPVRWRFGAAEGLSYVADIPYVENSEMDRKGYEPSNLMNYLDFSVDMDLGHLSGISFLKGWYLGYSIHHRSAIFESAAQFGRIRGGANYNTVYLQYHF